MRRLAYLIILLLSVSVVFAAYGPSSAPAGGSGSSPSSGTSSGGGGSGGGGGGGSGGGTFGTTYSLTDEQFFSGATKDVAEGDKIKFPLADVKYLVTITSISQTKVNLNISTGDKGTLTIAGTGKFELTGDNYYDLYMTYEDYNGSSNKPASIYLKKIHEEFVVPVANNPVNNPEVVSEQVVPPVAEESSNGLTGAVVSETSAVGSWFLVVIFFALALVIAGVGVYYYHQKAETKSSKKK